MDDARMHPLYECMGEEAFMNMSILISGDFDALAKLTVSEISEPESYRVFTDKSHLYEINMVHIWSSQPEEGITICPRSKELLEYIRDNCNQELELWIVWTDCKGDVEHREFYLPELTEDYLYSIYRDTPQGIALSRRITIRA
jgi:hypothetical protein